MDVAPLTPSRLLPSLPSPPAMRRLLSSLLLCALVACGERSGSGALGGTVVIGTPTDADALLMPLVDGIQGRIAADLLFDRLAEIGPSLNTVGDADFVPRLAKSWSWSADSLTITFALDPRAKWHDGRPVRAADVVFGLATIRDPANGSPLNSSIADILSVTERDSVSVDVRYAARSPEQFYSTTLIVPLPVHIFGAIPSGGLRTSPAARAPVGSGRFRFVSWEPGVRLELAGVRDHYRGRPRLDRVLFSVAPEPATGIARVKAGQTDVWDPLPAAEIPALAAEPHLRIVTAPGFDYAFFAFNHRDPRDSTKRHALFGDQAMRYAISSAVDRQAIARAIFDTLGLPGLGPFTRAQATADTTLRQIPFDRAVAEALLDSLGWSHRGPDGVRRRGNRRLTFAVIVPTSSRSRERAAVLIQEQLRAVGVAMTIDRSEFQAFLTLQNSGRFDAVLAGTRTTPSPRGVRGSWGSRAIPGGGTQNAWGYRSVVFDEALEQGLRAMDPVQSKAHFRRAYQQLLDDAAAVWLYEIRNASAVHRRYQLPAWRPDAWWVTLGEWSVDPAQRLPRDAAPATP